MTNTTFPVYSISISGMLSWQLHALNNEGNEGNQSLTRRYYIVEKNDPEPKYVNGVSGDMLKHIQAEHLHRIATDENLALSEGGREFNPDRIGFDFSKKDKPLQPITEKVKEKGKDGKEKEKDAVVLDKSIDLILNKCVISDLEGFMFTIKNDKTLKRESVIEFGAVVGIPSLVKTQSYFHAKYGVENPTPYNTQISSGLYATVLNIEAFRIGYNPHNFEYAIDTTERKKRLDALLKSVLYTYMQPNGAKRNTNLPHPDHFEGVISVSTRRCPAPMISPLAIQEENEDSITEELKDKKPYVRQIYRLKNALNNLNGVDSIHLYEFYSMAQFAEQIQTLIELAQPWESNNAEAIE